jgi:hypothetical protein
MSDFGGTIIIRTPTGNLTVRGSVSHKPLNFSAENIANYNATHDRTLTPTGYRAMMSLSNRDSAGAEVSLAALYAISGATVTFMHLTEKIDRTYIGCHFTGDPSVDDLTGEISGVEIVATGYVATPR